MELRQTLQRQTIAWLLTGCVVLTLVTGSLTMRAAQGAFGNDPPTIENFSVVPVGYGVWEIRGTVLTADGEPAYAEVTFGGLIGGATIGTVSDGTFLYAEMLDPQLGDSISAVAKDANGETSAAVYHVF